MEIVRLGLKGNSDYTPDILIEGYSTAIWTERFQDPGEFQIRTPKIVKTRDLLPRGTLISHRETREVMMVEDHLVGIDQDGAPELVITGRSLDFFSENRFIEGKYQKKRKMAQQYRPVGAAAVLLWQAFNNGSGKDVARLGDWNWNTKDQIPNVAIVDSVLDASGVVKNRWLEEGQLYPQLYSLLVRGDFGLRMVRPPSRDRRVVTVDTTVNNRGVITRTQRDFLSELIFELYQGVDRTDSQSDNTKVVFDFDKGDIDNGQYLWSIKEYKTVCEIMSSINIPDVFRRDTDEDFTGLDRRVMPFDAGSPEYPDEPAKPEPPEPVKQLKSNATQAEKDAYDSDVDSYNDRIDEYKQALIDWEPKHDVWLLQKQQIDDDFRDDASEAAVRELKKYRQKTLFSGDISPFAQYEYKQHYDLGDKVTLLGSYNQQVDMVVSEYIRTQDKEGGDRGYPGLTLP